MVDSQQKKTILWQTFARLLLTLDKNLKKAIESKTNANKPRNTPTDRQFLLKKENLKAPKMLSIF